MGARYVFPFLLLLLVWYHSFLKARVTIMRKETRDEMLPERYGMIFCPLCEFFKDARNSMSARPAEASEL